MATVLVTALPYGVAPVGLGTPALARAHTGTVSVGPAGDGDVDEDAQRTLEEVKGLYDEGKARYETLDYEGAIDLWTRAYAKVPPSEANAAIRNNLVYNIATAQEKAFELDGDVTHLRQARGLLERYLEDHKALYGDSKEAKSETDKVETRIASLDRKIAAKQSQDSAAKPGPAASAPVRPPSRKQAIADEIRSDPVLYKRYKSGKGMIVGGSVSLGVGLVSAAIAGAAAVDARVGAAAGVGAFALAAVVTGLVLIPIGAKRYKGAKREAEKRVPVTVVPLWGPQLTGVALGTRF